MIKVNDNTLFLTISVPDNSNKISITNPALKNNVVVNDARITPSERAKLLDSVTLTGDLVDPQFLAINLFKAPMLNLLLETSLLELTEI
jgi:hypothetical protein